MHPAYIIISMPDAGTSTYNVLPVLLLKFHIVFTKERVKRNHSSLSDVDVVRNNEIILPQGTMLCIHFGSIVKFLCLIHGMKDGISVW